MCVWPSVCLAYVYDHAYLALGAVAIRDEGVCLALDLSILLCCPLCIVSVFIIVVLFIWLLFRLWEPSGR